MVGLLLPRDIAVFGVRFDGDVEGGRPIRTRCEGVSGISEIVSFAREGKKGSSARDRFRRRYRRIASRM